MAFKRIQLRGISRTPSDRMSEDGGLAESLNVRIEAGESLPSIEPDDCTEELAGEDAMAACPIYVHESSSYRNIIAKREIYTNGPGILVPPFTDRVCIDESFVLGPIVEDADGFYEITVSADAPGNATLIKAYVNWHGREESALFSIMGTTGGDASRITYKCDFEIYLEREIIKQSTEVLHYSAASSKVIFTMQGPKENIVDVTSIGNILIVSTNQRRYFSLLVDGSYNYLGTRIPFPKANIFPENKLVSSGYCKIQTQYKYWESDKALLNKVIDSSFPLYSDAKADADKLREFAESVRGSYPNYYSRPVLVRYSLEILGGYEIISNPVLIGSRGDAQFSLPISNVVNHSTMSPYHVRGYRENDENGNTIFDVAVNVYSIYINWLSDKETIGELMDKWKDIVTRIKVYVSDDIRCESYDNISGCKLGEESSNPNTTEGILPEIVGTYPRFVYLEKDYPTIEEMDSKSVFFCVNEISLSDALSKTIKLNAYTTDNRYTLPTMPENIVDPNINLISETVLTYNKRLFMGNIRKDYPVAPGLFSVFALDNGDYGDIQYDIAFLMKNTGSTLDSVVRGEINIIAGKYGPVPYIVYPSPKCYAAIIKFTDGITTTLVKVKMREHPSMVGYSYFYKDTCPYYSTLLEKANEGLDEDIELLDNSIEFPEENNPLISSGGMVYASAVNNPFIVESFLSLSGEIEGMSLLTTALSSGQFGQFPVILFTTEGIWVAQVTEEGKFYNVVPLSRDRLLGDKKQILQLDQAITYFSPSGLKLLEQDANFSDISSVMNGKHYNLDKALQDMLDPVGFGAYISILTDSESFNDFMLAASGVFDGYNKRIIYFNNAKTYAYVFSLESKTWHKLSIPFDSEFIGVLNSYPEALVAFRKGDSYKIYNYSTPLSTVNMTESAEEQHSILITRPIDFDEPDVLKTINHLRIRGSYKRYECQLKFNTSLLVSDIEQILEATGYTHLFTTDDIMKLQRQGTLVKDIRKEDVDALNAAIVEKGIETLQLIRTEQPRVAYMLLASQDGINYKRLGSLRGKSWKMFRIVILASLKPYERISWIDFEYESRFKNRLR